jgi:hypothetical protein
MSDMLYRLQEAEKIQLRSAREAALLNDLLRVIKQSDVVSAERKKQLSNNVAQQLRVAEERQSMYEVTAWTYRTQLEREGVAG